MTAVLQVSFQEQTNGLIKVRADIQTQSEPPSPDEMRAALDLASALESLLHSCQHPKKAKHLNRSSKRYRKTQ
ncbi:hypothetical protein CYG68_03595 [Morganella morganii]|uniref:Uncharacterized protein n=1 Tax=Morganella morganii TaxID=582 RepID=A0A8I0Q2D6_MORMO|nr:hypothetical protein [Morganella morganii]MBE8611498.1 hypothetical protein [Morganella morganii]